MNVSVIGAGIMGLSTAWALRRAGHDVAVYEQADVPNELGSSFDQQRLIRYPYGASLGFTRMVADAYAAWERLWGDLGETHYVRTGTLALGRVDDSWAATSAATLGRLGIAAQQLSSAEVERIFPMLRVDDIRTAFYLDSGGALLASRIVAALLRWSRKSGVVVNERTRVARVNVETPSLELEDGTRVKPDALVVAVGAWVARLVPSMRDRVTPSRQVAAYVEPPARFAAHWRAGPMLLDLDGELGFYLVPPVAGTNVKIGKHAFTLRGDPDSERAAGDDEARDIFARARRTLRDFDDYAIVGARTCFYTVAPGERFIVEPHGRAWLISACSGHGFKFGPLIGEAVADGILGRRPGAEISRWATGDAGPEGPALQKADVGA